MKRALSTLKRIMTKKGHFDKNPGGGKDARKMKKGGRAGYKHGKWVSKPNPHIDMHQYVDKKTGKEVDDGKKKSSKTIKGSEMKSNNKRSIDRARREGQYGRRGAKAIKRKSNSIRTKDLEAQEDVMRSNIQPGEYVLSIGKEGPANKYSKFRKISFSKGGRASYNSGGAVLKGKKVGCQIK